MAFSLLDARNKYGGDAPDSITEYYRGGALVADTVGNGVIPSSGPISLSQLEAGASTSAATTILAHVWNNRGSYFFKGSSGMNWVWPGDVFDRTNSPVTRYTNSFTTSGGFNPAWPNHAAWTTVVAFSGGSGATITDVSTNAGGSVYQIDTELEMSWWVVHVPTTPTNVTSVSVTTSRSGGNSGSWSKCLVLPGRWGIDYGVRQQNMSTAGDWARALPSGRIGWLAFGNGYNGNMTPGVGGTPDYIIRGSEWWYNNSAMYLQFNPSGGGFTFYPGMFGYSRRYNEFYLIS